MPERVRQTILTKRETRLNPDETRFVELMRQYSRIATCFRLITNPEVTPRVVGQYRGVGQIVNVRDVLPLLPSEDKVYDLLTTPDGYTLIVVPVGQRFVTADLDEKTAVATLHLRGCKGIGFNFVDPTKRLLYGMGHFNYSQEAVLGQIIDLIKPERLSSVSLVYEKAHPAMKAMLVTTRGGVILRQESSSYSLTPVQRWVWEPAQD